MPRFSVLIVGLAAALLPPAPAQAQPTGRLLVGLEQRAAATAGAASALAARAGARPAGPQVPGIGLLTLRPAAGRSSAQVLAALRRAPGVAYAEPEHRFRLRALPDDPALTTPEPSAPALPLQWPAIKANLPAAWELSDGDGTLVAVIDTGADGSHPDLAGKIVDDIDLDAEHAGGALIDENGHGTHVASIACAATGNGLGIAGAGRDCRLLIVKSDLTDASIAEGIVAAADRGAGVINMSFGDDGSRPSRAVDDALRYAFERGAVLVAAAADEPIEEQGQPASTLQPTGTGAEQRAGIGLSVTAANSDDQRAPFAGRGSQISIAGYGAYGAGPGPNGVFALFPGGQTELERSSVFPVGQQPCRCRTSLNGDNRYAYLAGTSMATPQVAGAAALIRSLNPAMRASDVLRVLKRSARRPAGGGWSPELGWGLIDAHAALLAARRVDRTAPRARLAAPRRSGTRVVLRISAADRGRAGLRRSGVSKVYVYGARGRGRLRKLAVVRPGRATLRLEPGRWRLAARALDKAGNSEAAPRRPEATVTVRR